MLWPHFLDAPTEFVTEHLTKFFVHIKKSHCGPPDGSQSDNLYKANSGFQHSGREVICPFVGSRVKEASKFAGFWVDAGQVCTLL